MSAKQHHSLDDDALRRAAAHKTASLKVGGRGSSAAASAALDNNNENDGRQSNAAAVAAAAAAAGIDPTTDMPDGDFEALWSTYNERLRREKENEELGMDIFPDPGFVVKTWLDPKTTAKPKSASVPMPGGGGGTALAKQQQSQQPVDLKQCMKVFINMCSEPNISEPCEDVGPDGEDRVRVPLSCGPAMQAQDKTGVACLVYDVVFSPITLDKCAADHEFRALVIQFALQNIQVKHEVVFVPQVRFPNVRYKSATAGSSKPPAQRIRRKAVPVQPIIETMDDDDDADADRVKQAPESLQRRRDRDLAAAASSSSSVRGGSGSKSSRDGDGSNQKSDDVDVTPEYEIVCHLDEHASLSSSLSSSSSASSSSSSSSSSSTTMSVDEFYARSDVAVSSPSSFVVTVRLPRVQRIREMNIQYTHSLVALTSGRRARRSREADRRHRYSLTCVFPFPVIIDDDGDGDARPAIHAVFDRSAHVLTLTCRCPSLPLSALLGETTSSSSSSSSSSGAPGKSFAFDNEKDDGEYDDGADEMCSELIFQLCT